MGFVFADSVIPTKTETFFFWKKIQASYDERLKGIYNLYLTDRKYTSVGKYLYHYNIYINIYIVLYYIAYIHTYVYYILPNSFRESKQIHCRRGFTMAFAALAPEIATAGTPIPGKIWSPANTRFEMGVLPSLR